MSDNKPQIAIAVVKNSQGKILIAKRVRSEHAVNEQTLTWVFPGGKPIDDESLEHCAVRETRDETGYNIEVVKKISERDYPLPTVHLTYFECVLKDYKLSPIQEVNEIESIKWVLPSELKDYFTTDMDPNVAKMLGVA